MKRSNLFKPLACTLVFAMATTALFTGCSGSKSSGSSASLQTLDLSTVMTSFSKGSLKSDNWDRTNVTAADTTTTATIAKPESGGETTPIVMMKGNPGTLDASGNLTTDPTKNSYFSSALLLKDGSAAQYGSGIYKFKEKVSGATADVFNAAIVFKDAAPQKELSDDSVTKALSIVTYGGDIQIQRNYKSGSKVVKQELVKDTGVKITDNKYHYFILAMQDTSSTTKVKLWIDGNVAYEGNVAGITGKGAVQLLQNSTPMYDSSKKALTTKDYTGKTVVLTACAEAYFGGYDDGPTVSNISLK